MNSDDISTYYDGFRDTRMSRYRVFGNRRLKLAANRAKSLIREDDIIADFGCGIGLVSEELAGAKPGVRVVAVDISAANIEYAKHTVKRENVAFRKVGLNNGCETLKAEHSKGYNVLVLVDVMEHIAEEARSDLLEELAGIAAENAYLVLTYPSPEYQRYLLAHQPDELQIIDNIIERTDLLSEAAQAGWTLKAFEYVDVWMSNQYIHAVFQKGETPLALERVRRPWFDVAVEGIGIVLQFPFRVGRYGWPAIRLRK